MGLANLVPGISGGTMLLAAGVYPDFIQAIADLSRLKIHFRALLTLGVVGGAAAISILFGAGTLKDLVLAHRWMMYSLFIGLTLGGVPVVWGLIKRPDRSVFGGAVMGFFGMLVLAILQGMGVTSASGSDANVLMMFVGGVAGASAMILPGVSGGYLLLVLGLYVPILTGIHDFKNALKAADFSAMIEPILHVVAPVGVGVVIGVAVVSNVLKWLLEHFRNATLGVLLGLLVGAVVGLYPFQQGVMPQVGDVVKGRTLTPELLTELDADDYPVEWFAPTTGQGAGSLALILFGITVTGTVAWFGRREEEDDGRARE